MMPRRSWAGDADPTAAVNRAAPIGGTLGPMSTRLGELLRDLPDDLQPTYVGCDADTVIGALREDSRLVEPSDVFIARTGAQRDGHVYTRSVLAAGGICVVRAGRGQDVSPRVEVADPDAALPILAATAAAWPGRALALTGVTGTNGKTTVTHMLSSILRAANTPHARVGTTGHWVVDQEMPTLFTTPFPIALQRLLQTARDRGATHAVMEVSSHALAQARVAPLAFDAVALTSFGQDHLDFHADMEDYLAAKCLLPRRYLKPTGLAMARHGDDPPAVQFLRAASDVGARVWTFQTASDNAPIDAADFRISRGAGREPHAPRTLRTPAGAVEVALRLPGAFNLENAMVAAGLALAGGVGLPEIATGLSAAVVPGRLEPIHTDADEPRVFVDYAHTPDAIRAALSAVGVRDGGKRWIVVGCGGDRDRGKRPRMAKAALEGADVCVATSDNPRTEDPERILDDMLEGLDDPRVHRVVDREDAIFMAITRAAPEDTVVIAGKGHERTQTIGDQTLPFDDRERARAALAARRP